MLDKNSSEPILSELEIRFLLSDQPIRTPIPRPARSKAKVANRNARKRKGDPLSAGPREQEQP